MDRPVSETVLWAAYQAGATDAHGNPAEGWATAISKDVWAFDPGSSSEPREGQNRVIVEPTLYMPSTVVFGHRDRVTARGLLYEVEGVTREWVHPSDATRRGNVCTLRRVDG